MFRSGWLPAAMLAAVAVALCPATPAAADTFGVPLTGTGGLSYTRYQEPAFDSIVPPNPGAAPVATAAGVWFVDASDQLYRIDATGHTTLVVWGTSINAVAADTHGDIWAIETQPNFTRDLLELSPSGAALTRVPFPARTFASSLSVGPDGTVWIPNAGSVLTYSPGAGSGFQAVPGYTGSPLLLAAAADGAAWVVERPTSSFDDPGVTPVTRLTRTGPPQRRLIPNATTVQHPTSIAASPDGGAWIGFPPNQMMHVTSAGGRAYATPECNCYALAVTPDGDAWATEGAPQHIYTAHLIFRITTAGLMNEFAIQGMPSWWTVLGPDGRVWTSDFDYHRWIAVVPPAYEPVGPPPGTWALHDVPTTTAALNGFVSAALGGDRNVWFTEYSADKLGYITSDGSLHELSLPEPGAPFQVLGAPGGSVWLTSLGFGAYYVDAAHDVVEVPLSAPPLSPAVDARGDLWLRQGPDLFRLSPKGHLARFPQDPAAQPGGLVPMPDGSLWYVDCGRNLLVHLDDYEATSVALPPGPDCSGSTALAGDGTLWAAAGDGAVALHPDGTLDAFAISGAPIVVTPGPGGAVLAVAYTHSYAGGYLLTPAGPVAIPDRGCGGGSGSVGPDFRLWHTSPSTVSRVSLDGACAEYSAGRPSLGGAVVTGADDRLYFVEAFGGGGAIGRPTLGVDVYTPDFDSPGLVPAAYSSPGRAPITVRGSNFTGLTKVRFGSAAAAAVTVLSDGELIATPPRAHPGTTVELTITTEGGTATGATYRYGGEDSEET